MVDYAFAPGTTGYDAFARQLYTNRPNTTLVQKRGVNTIATFFNYLDTQAGLALPADDLYVVSHGNDKAWMQIHLDDAPNGVNRDNHGHLIATTFEVADAAVTAGSVKIPTQVNHDASGQLGSMSTNIRGCRIGASEPFVDKLKEAFGGDSPVTAAKHFMEVYQLSAGMMEFLLYGFSVIAQNPFPDKTATATAFDSANFTYADGTTNVPTALWDDWIPKDVSVGRRDSKTYFIKLGQTLGKQTTIPQAVGFRHDTPRFTYTISGLGALPAATDRITTLRDALNKDAANPGSSFASDHPFPMYKRYGHDDIDTFVDQMNWTFSWDAANANMVCVGSQHEYTVVVPLTDPPDLGTGTLIFNFYPPAGSPLSAVTNLMTSDSTLFYTA